MQYTIYNNLDTNLIINAVLIQPRIHDPLIIDMMKDGRRWRARAVMFAKDTFAAMAVFLTCVPRSLASGQASGLGTIYGEYTSTFAPFIYFLFGSSRHLAVGTLIRVMMLAVLKII